MKLVTIMLVAGSLLLGAASGLCETDVNLGLSVKDGEIKDFRFSIGAHFGATEEKVAFVSQRNIPDEELVVVFLIARKAEVSPEQVIRLRSKGRTWMEIVSHFGLDAGVFYVPLKTSPGPPFGKAYGHFKNKKRSSWGSIVLTDAEIVNFANLIFVCERYGYPADEIIKMRQSGKSYVSIHHNVKTKKSHTGDANKQASPGHAKSKSAAKGKKK